MAATISRPWWIGLVYAVGAINAIGFVLGLFREFDPPATVAFLIATILVIAGLTVRKSNAVLGSWLIILACIPPLLPFWIVIPPLLSIATVASGIATGELKLVNTTRRGGEPD